MFGARWEPPRKREGDWRSAPKTRPLPPRFPVWRQKWESPNPVDAPEPDGLPSSALGESFYDPAGLLRLPAPPFLPPAACCRRFPQSAPARPPHPHSRANRFSAFLRSEEHTSEL